MRVIGGLKYFPEGAVVKHVPTYLSVPTPREARRGSLSPVRAGLVVLGQCGVRRVQVESGVSG
jgi:hypothetical protein